MQHETWSSVWVPRTLTWKHFDSLLITITKRYVWVLSIFNYLFLFKLNKANYDMEAKWQYKGMYVTKEFILHVLCRTFFLYLAQLCINIYWEHWAVLNMLTLISLVNKTFANIQFPRSTDFCFNAITFQNLIYNDY